ncbi:MAG TPA: glutathione S-transferase N-terminal domain-containing protein [Bordetella sp.]|jgi:glutathione S-transferase|nr:glutathione S-transferase N-terminal domain-containing protein [Bordetella sp.]
MLKIWGRASSTNVQKVLWCVGELGLPYERIDAGMEFGVNDTPEFRRLNPNGLVPVIEHEGLTLWESHAIVRYLARQYGLGTLCPEDPRVCADSDRWMDWCATLGWPAMRALFLGYIRTPAAQRDIAQLKTARDIAARAMALLDAHLRDREHLVGAPFTMGDIPMGVVVHRWYKLPIEREPLENLARYYATLKARPAFRLHADVTLA